MTSSPALKNICSVIKAGFREIKNYKRQKSIVIPLKVFWLKQSHHFCHHILPWDYDIFQIVSSHQSGVTIMDATFSSLSQEK